ncbi:hypothetical protein [Roseateles cavernae]|uniref:hypothetical protein n=1 Tax=Roseateles cavernae TaxID=3153578 RepID=UPI0032E414BC
MYSKHRAELLQALEPAHARFYASAVFGGPSLHFHLRALSAAESNDINLFAEASYAMLAAWGMHRMGQGGAKMTEFAPYEASLRRIWPLLMELRAMSSENMQPEHWCRLEHAFMSIKAMRSSFSLVANSKVLAHVLPNLVPPVDRQYTIRFLIRSSVLPKNIGGEWLLLRGFLEGFFYPILAEKSLSVAAARWAAEASRYPWNTSLLKTVDNLLVGHVRRDV